MKKLLFFIIAILAVINITYSQWSEQTSGVTGVLYSVSAPTDSVVWSCGAAGKVIRTTNGGTTWTNASGTGIPTTLALYNIWGIDSSTALVTGSGSSAFIYRTNNGGATWNQVFTQTGGFIDAIWMTSPTSGFAYGDPVSARWSLWKTTNGGLSWDSTGMYLQQAASEAGYNNAMFVSGTNIWFGTSAGKIYYSAAGGLTGTWLSQTVAGTDVEAIWFNSPPVGMSGGTNLLSTSNNGVNWSTVTAPGTAVVTGITGLGTNWYFTRQATSIYNSTDNGMTFASQYTAPAGNFYHLTRAIAGTRMWAVRSNGGIATTGSVIGIQPISNQVPASYNLSQNYPNPFNPTTNFTFALPKTTFVSIKVYDLIGREVAVLSNEVRQAGTYKVDFDASKLTSGVYFYTLRTDNFNQTKKMILVK